VEAADTALRKFTASRSLAMPLFRCFIRGENFPGELLGQSSAIGFHATRFVDAGSAAEAEQIAVVALRQEAALTVTMEPKVKNARVYFESIVEVPADTARVPNTGFSFYSMDDHNLAERRH
jgi:hypothetical protein